MARHTYDNNNDNDNDNDNEKFSIDMTSVGLAQARPNKCVEAGYKVTLRCFYS